MSSNADWGQTGAPGSVFNSAFNRGRGRGSGRGGRGNRGSRGGGSGGPNRNSQQVPSVVVPPPESPAGSAPSTSKPQNRRKRSQNPKNSRPPVLDDSLLKPQKQKFRAPHSAPATRDPPPHLSNHFDIRTDIDALVERVRAVAMADNRPTTPGSHIDWAGDEDDTLPDLDDWGVKTSPKLQENVELISPIIVEGLKPLPDLVIKSSTSSAEASPCTPVLDPFLSSKPPKDSVDTADSLSQPPSTAELAPSLHPSLPPKPAVAEPPVPSKSTGATPMRNKPIGKTTKEIPQAKLSDSAGQPVTQTLEPTASLPQKPISAPSDITSYSNHSFTHNRSQTLGRPETGFIPRFSRSGTSTPRGGGAANHNRTHSTPPAFNNHRTPHSRPVLTGDAISRLTRTINAGLSPSRSAVPATAKD